MASFRLPFDISQFTFVMQTNCGTDDILSISYVFVCVIKYHGVYITIVECNMINVLVQEICWYCKKV